MRVVLDTNVFVSGVFFKGVPSRILKAWAENKSNWWYLRKYSMSTSGWVLFHLLVKP